MKNGDRVFHKNLRRFGTYIKDDWASDDSCFVNFDTEDGYEDVLCVSKNQLETDGCNLKNTCRGCCPPYGICNRPWC